VSLVDGALAVNPGGAAGDGEVRLEDLAGGS
jgi:hypothetical protein